jgi:hypothetical protein
MINYETLNKLVSQVKGTTFAGITTKTDVKLLGGKKNLMQGRVQKITEDANIILYSNSELSGYAEMVKRRMMSEGKNPDDFVMKPRAWGARVGKSPFIEHNGKYYLECIFRSPGKTTYLLDGNPVAKEEIEGLPDQKEKTETYENSQGGIENKIVLRTFALDSIVSVKLKNEVLNV